VAQALEAPAAQAPEARVAQAPEARVAWAQEQRVAWARLAQAQGARVAQAQEARVAWGSIVEVDQSRVSWESCIRGKRPETALQRVLGFSSLASGHDARSAKTRAVRKPDTAQPESPSHVGVAAKQNQNRRN
jgi:hypothetical protein